MKKNERITNVFRIALRCMLPYVYLIGVFPFFIIIIFLIFSRKKTIIYIDSVKYVKITGYFCGPAVLF